MKLKFWRLWALAFIATLSSEALAAEPTAIPDDPNTKLYLLEDETGIVPLLISNGKAYAIRCQDQKPQKIIKALGFSPVLWFLPRKSIDDFEIIESAYGEQPILRCFDSKRRLLVEAKDDHKRYLIHFYGDPDHKVLYEVGCQGLVDALGLTKATPMDELSESEKIRLDSFSREYINCKAGVPTAQTGVPMGLFRDKDGPKMVGLPGGTFRMGDINGKGHKDEQPVHEVKINSFAISRYEITVDEYKLFDSSQKERGNYPVTNVSLKDAIAYAAWLSEKTGKHYRLPTEVEWEYAARAGTESIYGWGDEINQTMANYRELNEKWDKKESQAVGAFKPNAFEIYDMVGNVLEWTCSKYEASYQGTEKKCLKGGKASQVVLRGGSFIHNEVRIARRYRLSCVCSDANIGFRVVRVND